MAFASIKICKPYYNTRNQLREISKRVVEKPSSDGIVKRNHLFNLEQQRQREAVGRVEKIEVRYLGLPKDLTLVMNAGISTPYNCAQHLSEGHCKRAALALVDGKLPWDIHRPLEETCTLQLLNLKSLDPDLVNRVFWRTCSFILGAALEKCFKEEANLQLHSFPTPNIKSGSFIYDIALGVKSWEPTKSELRAISAEIIKVSNKNLKIERLEVGAELAQEMFKTSRFKSEQLPNIAARSNGKVTLYRMGTHIDISRGPMVGSSSFIGKCTIPAVIKLAEYDDKITFFRVQGVALPAEFMLNHFAYSIIENRAKKLNPARIPNQPYEDSIQQIA